MEEFTDSMRKNLFRVWLFLAVSIGHMLNASQKPLVHVHVAISCLDVPFFQAVLYSTCTGHTLTSHVNSVV